MHQPTIARYEHAGRRSAERRYARRVGIMVAGILAPFAIDARATETHRYFTPAGGYGLPFAHGPSNPDGLRRDHLRRAFILGMASDKILNRVGSGHQAPFGHQARMYDAAERQRHLAWTPWYGTPAAA